MDLQKKFFTESAKSYPDCLKITLWKELGYLVQKYRIAILKTFFPKCCQILFQILFLIWGYLITDFMIDNKENKIENLCLQVVLEVSYFH